MIVTAVTSMKSCQHTDQRSIVVSGRLSLFIVISLISKVVIGIRSTNKSTSKEIRIARLSSIPGRIACLTTNKTRINLKRDNEGGSVVYLPWANMIKKTGTTIVGTNKKKWNFQGN
ncbi:hypothetical protein H5410_019623 [Solanum commersonii]|uniref:Uncharacterized protein n=1 Tax=Solanum commersonii TaxID=4109 RepID=A0A9J5ZBQ8_SOLCO|nr:hypothetical protein H5410_019623 [Solanum commersonii]